MTMRYVRFGKTELQMPVLSCGGMRYQKAWQPDAEIDAESQKNVEDCIRRALDLGINHIETARGYGTSELQLGRILPKLPRDEMIVQTKITPKYNPVEFRAEVEKSLTLLGLDHIDLLGIHGINNDETLRMTFECGTMDMAEELVREGKVRHVGFSTHGACETIVQAIESGRLSYVNLHYFYIYQSNRAAVDAAKARDMGVFIISPSDKGGMLYNPPEKLVELCKPLTPIQFNDLFTLLQGGVDTLSIGASRPTDFDKHVMAIEYLDTDGPALVEEISKRIERTLAESLGAEWMAHCHENLPRWEDTPGEINLPVTVLLYNLAKGLDMVEYGKMRYNLLGNGGHWFPGKNADAFLSGEVSEDALRGVLKDHADPDRVIAVLREVDDLIGGEAKKRLSEE